MYKSLLQFTIHKTCLKSSLETQILSKNNYELFVLKFWLVNLSL